MQISKSYVDKVSIFELANLPRGTEIYAAIAAWQGDEQFMYAVGIDCYIITEGSLTYLQPTDEPLLTPFLNENRFWIEMEEVDSYIALFSDYVSEESFEELASAMPGDIIGAILGITFHRDPNHFKIKGL